VDNTDKIFGDVMSRVRFLQIFWMMHVGNDTTEESNRAIKRRKKVHGVIEYIENQFQEKKKIALYPCCTNFSSKTAPILAPWGFKIPSQPGCGNFSKRDDRKGLTTAHHKTQVHTECYTRDSPGQILRNNLSNRKCNLGFGMSVVCIGQVH
jgi:hypothetical protein